MDQTTHKIRWGVIGLGKIAHKFVSDLLLLDTVVLDAVASRSLEKAAIFSKKYSSNKFYGSYLDLMLDEAIEIIYIATPHNTHKSITILALEHKKAVLCEKPFAINRHQVFKMIETSQNNETFLMEALWTRFIPVIVKIKEVIDQGTIGEISYINADFSFKADPSIQRIYDKELGGGSLLDIGIYPVFLAYLFLGIPEKITTDAHFFETGADASLGMIFSYKKAYAMLYSSFNSSSERVAKISGTLGEIIIDTPWNESNSFSILKNDETTKYSLPTVGRGYTHQVEECNKCLTKKVIESSVWSHQNSRELIFLLDRIRKTINLDYQEDSIPF